MKPIIINGGIGYDTTYESVKQQFDGLNGEDIEIQISSFGGFVSDGILIYNMIRDYKRKYPESQIMAIIKSDALSAASYIFSNPDIDLRYVEDNAMFMMHNPFNGVIGDYREMEKNADFLERMTAMMSKSYALVSGKKIDEIRKMMDEETWLFSEEIVKAGFADGVIETNEKKDKDEEMAVATAKFQEAKKKVMSEPYSTNEFYQMVAKMESCIDDVKQDDKSDNINKNMEVTMTLQEFLGSNPEAKAEFEEALQSAEAKGKEEAEKDVMADRKRISNILNSAGVVLSDVAIEALEKGIDDGEFAKAELKRQREMRNDDDKGSIFGSLRAKPTPQDQATDEDKEQAKAFEEKARDLAKQFYGGK